MSFKYPVSSYNSRSAQIILPLLFQKIKIYSILDVGCGIGTWLEACLNLGVMEIQGVDSSVESLSGFSIDEKYFAHKDVGQEFEFKRRYDLVICLEVAEHLPEEKANTLLDNLTKHSDLILFSAAIPDQEGDGHVNEQWPSYWQRKFQEKGYYFSDYIRPLIWNHKEVDVWYKQNTVVAIKNESWASKFFAPVETIQDVVHPSLYELKAKQAARMALFEQGKGSLKLLLRYIWKTIVAKLSNQWCQ